MKDKYSIAQRNQVVEENLCCIDTVLRHHQGWVRQARLEYDDLYQSLAVCLVRSRWRNTNPALARCAPTFTGS